ncbi:Fibronectin type 3 and ankyrin repeat domains protein 1 [Desmophyllum pertusum]|uniref:Fibronectin type 3 and ankyrin repeat domains protein 1 n=1 Tax=Desmophyllum pertusum TaxID=174260 RepID=A0A9W9ZYK2_9CNID|nr:Fibronectin type 3 and ankyrin repeat domains protein 1 [Desmophyllum pertusum]
MGKTTYITVDKGQSSLETTFSELEFIDNFTLTFKVDFMGEESVDLGGSHAGNGSDWLKYFFPSITNISHLTNSDAELHMPSDRNLKTKYFDNGLRQYLSQEYFYVWHHDCGGDVQNGQMPAFIEDHIFTGDSFTKQKP